jgi:RecB family exonuclease
MYESCPQRYAYRYVERRPGEFRPGQFTFGSAIHRAFEAFVRQRIGAAAQGGAGEEGTGAPGVDVLWGAFDAAMAASGLPAEEIDAARRRAAPALARFMEREAGDDTRRVGVELGFGVDIDMPGEATGLRLVGYVDRVDVRPDGTTEVIDYKTGRPRGQADVDQDPQLTAYAFACARGGLRDPATGEALAAASRLGLYFADSGSLVWTARTAAQLTAFEEHVVDTARCVRRREFAARPIPGTCHWCEYRAICPDAAIPRLRRQDE